MKKTTKELYKDASRWDYAIGYNGKVYYAEVHPASSKNIDEMFKKRQWLEAWLRDKATKLNYLPSGNPKFVWIATASGIHLQPNSAQAKRLATMNMRPVKLFKLE